MLPLTITSERSPSFAESIQKTWDKAPTWKKVAFVAAVTIGALVVGLLLASPLGLGILPIGLPLALGASAAIIGLDVGATIALYQTYEARKEKGEKVVKELHKPLFESEDGFRANLAKRRDFSQSEIEIRNSSESEIESASEGEKTYSTTRDLPFFAFLD